MRIRIFVCLVWSLLVSLCVLHRSLVSSYPTDFENSMYTMDEGTGSQELDSNVNLEDSDLASALLKLDTESGRRHYRHRLSKRSDTCQNQLLETKILCERCAKYTKSHTVYTMCCDTSDPKVRVWCKNFLEYDFNLRN